MNVSAVLGRAIGGKIANLGRAVIFPLDYKTAGYILDDVRLSPPRRPSCDIDLRALTLGHAQRDGMPGPPFSTQRGTG